MKKHRVFVRPAGHPNDPRLYLAWALENQGKNDFDAEVAKYPSTTTFCAYDGSGPLAYMPNQRPIVLESFAPRPGATRLEKANALRELVQNAVSQAHISGAGEIWFLGSDPKTDQFAGSEIFELVPHPVYRVKLRELEDRQ